MEDKKLILLVDDDVDLVDINKTVLERNGFNVITAYTGEDGLKKANEAKPNLIVLDVMMETGSDGFNTAKALKKSDNTKDIPIIMLTSVNETVPFNFEPDEENLPVERFLEKPLDPEKLKSEVQELLK